ncbi:MAG TPA: hypothetical protein DF712_15245, partial [Balneola sp.]|nr:hypothetical protein [Balneola sp.]
MVNGMTEKIFKSWNYPMTYKSIITTIQLRPHPNADKLQLADVVGHQLICDSELYSNGDTVIFFPEGGQLTDAVCFHNNLYREGKGTNKNPERFGYFDSSRRIRSIKLRGEISEGFMLKIENFEFTGANLSGLRPGMQLDELGGVALCKKYETRATRQARAKAGGTAKKDINLFAKVGDTPKFRYLMNTIPEGAVLTISEKIHGTSGRTGYIS